MRLATREELAAALESQPGLIPVQLDVRQATLTWQDLGAFHCYDGFFDVSLRIFDALLRATHQEASARPLVTSVDVLGSDDVLTDCVPPTGFIFHAGRCGSTALARSLARSRAHLVFGEAGPHNAILRIDRDLVLRDAAARDRAVARYRRLLLAMGRRRRPGIRRHFIKFTSFNVLFLRFIREAFPNVPAIFLYREPGEVLRSVRRRPLPWLNHRSPYAALVAAADRDHHEPANGDYGHALTQFFRSALACGGRSLQYLDHRCLTAEHLPAILEVFGVQATASEMVSMQEALRYDAKTTFPEREFQGSGEVGSVYEADVGDETRRLYHELTMSPHNVVTPAAQH